MAAPAVQSTEALDAEIAVATRGDVPVLAVLMVRTEPAGRREPCLACDGTADAAVLDLALGEHAGLVAEAIPGTFCWHCGNAVVTDGGQELRQRLMRFDPMTDGHLTPSLLYDTPAHPTAVQLEVTTRCNLRCDYCSNRLLIHRADVPVAQVEAWLDRIDLALVDDVDFTGLGEPSLHRDLPRIIAGVKARGAPTHLRMVSNGVALTPRRFEPLCEAGLTSISISVDSLDPERFARSRSGARLDRVLANVEALAAYRERNNLRHLRLKLKAVLLDDPYRDAERLLEYSARVGLDMPHFSCLDSRGSTAPLYEQPWLRDDWSGEIGPELLAWAQARWEELDPHREAPRPSSPTTSAQRAAGLWRHPGIRPPADVCRWAVDAVFITADGGTLSCCEQMIDMPRMQWGRLTELTMAQLWSGPLLWGYRLPLSIGVVPAPCAGCSWAPRHPVEVLSAPAGR